MGSEAHLVLLEPPSGLLDRLRRRLDDLEQRWSRFLPGSEISQLNRSAGRPVVVSTETYDVVAAAVDAWHWSQGRFDPTVERTMVAAGYDRPRPDVGWAEPRPSRHRPCPTPAGIVLDPYPQSITLPDGVSLDLGGIGKGAAADLLAADALAGGAGGCCINVGGDLRVAGRPPVPEGWRIALDVGGDHRGASSPTVGLVEGAVCTSTSRRRTWRGPRGPEHHLRDPSSGAPLWTGLASVTVIGARASQAEVLAKTAFAAGAEAAPALIGSTGATGLLVTDDGLRIELDGLAAFVRSADQPSEQVARPAGAVS